MDDGRLLKQYVRDGSQEAFAHLVRRYLDMVYWTCYRELRDASLAEEAAQAVFLLLAQKARVLEKRTALSGWLFQTAVFVAKNARRQEQRRIQQERKAALEMLASPHDQARAWEESEPLLNAAITSLSEAEQTLLMQRFWEDLPLAEIGRTRGLTEDAARMRVNRALEKLRRWFAARDICFPLSALETLLPQAVRPAPAPLAATLSRFIVPAAPALVSDTPAHHLAQKVDHQMNRKRTTRLLAATIVLAGVTTGTVGAVRMVAENHAARIAAVQKQDQTQALDVLNQMYATYQAMHTFRCAVTSREEPESTAQDATYEIERPNKIRFQRATLLGEAESEHALAVSDGQTLFVTGSSGMAGASRFVKIPLDPTQGGRSLFADFGGMAAWGTEPDAGMPDVMLGIRLHESDYPQMLPPQYSMGTPVTLDLSGIAEPVFLDVVIAHIPWRPGTPGREWKGATEIVTYYIGHADHLLYKLTAQDSLSQTDWDTRTEYINDMEINKPIPASDFMFSPPPGSKEVSNAHDVVSNE